MSSELSTSGFISAEEERALPRFTELEEIPSAGFNVLVRAKRYGRWWVLKALKEKLRGEALYEELLKKEFEILISMQHPGVVFGVGLERVEGLGLCIVMEWIDGVSLKEWLTTSHRSKERWRVALQIVDALEYIHGKQTAHRDLKPSNILITRNGSHVKLIDFGLSDADNYAIFKQPAGSAGYISPEQASGGKSDVRNDIYSLGCVLDDLKLGARYRGVVRKCKADSNRRYSHVGEVRRALLSRSRLGWWSAAIVVFVAGGFWWANRHDNAVIQEQIMEVSAAKEEKLNNAIAEGKRRMDEVVARSKWEEVDDIVAYGELLFAVAKEMQAVWESYPQELDSTYTDVDRAQVKEVLTTYYSELYKPIYNKNIRLQAEYQKEMEQSLK